MSENFKLIINKLDRFIRKYYYDLLLKGFIITMISALAMILLVSLINLLGQFESNTRTYIFYITLGIFSVIFFLFIIMPLVKIIKVARRISYQTASVIISRFFSDIQDKLLNVLELKEDLENSSINQDLLLASIEEKTNKIKVFDYNVAIDFKKNLKILIYFVGLIGLSALLLAMYPDFVSKGTNPIIFYDKDFESGNEINIELLNDSLSVKKGQDFELKIGTSGIDNEDNLFIEYGNRQFLMNNYLGNAYSYSFSSINNDLSVGIVYKEQLLGKFEISVLPGPSVIDYKITVIAPEYTLEEKKEYSNVGEIVVNTGAHIEWTFNTHNAEKLKFIDNGNVKYLSIDESGAFTADTILYDDYSYEVSVSNSYFINENPMLFRVEVIPDMFPDIYIECLNDTLMESDKLFRGKIEDDFGFDMLEFVIINSENSHQTERLMLNFDNNILEQEFYYSFDMKNTGYKKIAYYFEVRDNDAINGGKSSRSKTFYFEFPDEREIFERTSQAYESNENKIQESRELTEEILDEINKLKEIKLNDGGSDWEVEQLMEDIFDKNKKLDKLVNEISEGEKNKSSYLSDFTEQDEEIIKKQQEIEPILENLIDEDLKQLLKELDKLSKETNRNMYRDIFEEIEITYEELSDQLDENLELLRRMEVEEKLGMAEKMLDKLGDEQMQLSESYDDNSLSKEETAEEQEKLKEKFENIKDELDETEMLNEKLNNKFDLDELEGEKKSVEENFEELEDNLEKRAGKKKNSEGMKNNAGELKEMAEKFRVKMKESNFEKAMLDVDNLRNILENLVEFSFSQEDNMYSLNKITPNDPKMEKIIGYQNKIENDFNIVEDSLKSLGKSSPELGATIRDEIKRIKLGFSRVDQSFKAANNSMVKLEQQHIMTSANNIGLILSELLKQWMDMINKEQGGNCENPQGGNGQSQIKSMLSGQKGLEEQIKKMIEELKNGKGKNSGKMTEGMGKMLAEQEIMKKMLQDIISKGGVGNETKRMLENAQEIMDQIQQNIIDQNINDLTLRRQGMVIKKLLEAENAEMERDLEEIRESRRGENNLFSNPEESLEYKEIKREFSDIFKRHGIKFNNYYKKRYREYLMKINEKK